MSGEIDGMRFEAQKGILNEGKVIEKRKVEGVINGKGPGIM